MRFGIFDQNDRGPLPLPEHLECRLQLCEFYDRAGFDSYHVSEHHATPLSLTPATGVFLSALAQRTRRLRFGPLVYILPLRHPLQVAEEVAMLDQMSGGRFELGVGRGISPHELCYHGIDPAEAPAMYREALDLLLLALTGVNYLVSRFAFGDLTHSESLRSARLFATEVMPALRERSRETAWT